MLLLEWTEAQNGTWIDPQLVSSLQDPLEKELMGGMKLAYQSGKGSKRLMPVLFPIDILPAMEKFVELRKECGVSENNPFFVPNTVQNSTLPAWRKSVSVRWFKSQPMRSPAERFTHQVQFLRVIYGFHARLTIET
ncbi:histone-lysine N-methyltransferase setd8-a [Plakobranchus ocellatus]|uniref:Histone-lysine N-methyltransferase setd8-a n=1 Tax=Plakobranchus ocellatus TaxID=259542 RepID=A0AAV4CZI2_9GAST|nr:histone-lysine N-methyltransferase setd8-a [Plakobranchus ocellatus]